MTRKPIGQSAEATADDRTDRTAICRSEGEWLVRRGAVVEAEDAERDEAWGVVGSHVTRLHGTPWRAQLEHGLSSSHCRWLSRCLGWAGPCAPGGGLYLHMASLALSAAQS